MRLKATRIEQAVRTVPRRSRVVQSRRVSLVVRNGFETLHIVDMTYSGKRGVNMNIH